MSRAPGWWSRLPLRTQLTAAFTVLLLVGLVLTGAVALTLLERSLVSQVDAQLTASAGSVVREALHGDLIGRGGGDGDGGLPSDYQVVFQDPDGAARTVLAQSDATSSPDIPSLTTDEVAARDGEAFTVAGGGDDSHWRVVVVNVTSGGAVLGSAAIALPMDAAEATLSEMRRALLGIALSVLVVGAVGGWWAVRRSLRPLGRIEDTAAAIAAGDLSRRVPGEPATTEVGRLSAALNTMLGQIERAFEVRAASEARMRQFVADASHELRTPLATIRGYGELYRMGALPQDEQPAAMRRIEDSATRMGALVEDLLHLARLDENRPMRHDVVDLAVLAADATADLRALDASRLVRLAPALDGGTTAGAVTTGDEARLRQVLANLIGNVVQHTPAGTPVEIAVGRVGAEAVIEVRDHGPGIPPEHAARVFERFYRVDAARGRDSGGAGLGMAIVAAIVDAHAGRVELAPTAGGGTTVRVSLTAAVETEPETDTDTADAEPDGDEAAVTEQSPGHQMG